MPTILAVLGAIIALQFAPQPKQEKYQQPMTGIFNPHLNDPSGNLDNLWENHLELEVPKEEAAPVKIHGPEPVDQFDDEAKDLPWNG